MITHSPVLAPALAALLARLPSAAGAGTLARTVGHRFTVAASVVDVFPLFDPRHEAEWAPTWRYEPLVPRPFRTEANAVFAVPHDGTAELWTVIDFDPARHHAEYLAVWERHLLRRVSITCTPDGAVTRVEVTYTLTALTDEGMARSEAFGPAFLQGWEAPVRAAAGRRAGRPQ
jgi:hypothetical protein